MITTLRDFILRIETLDDISDAYYVFEGECTDLVRRVIYNMTDPTGAEPFRDAMHIMGYKEY
jgi:hypothetical protein